MKYSLFLSMMVIVAIASCKKNPGSSNENSSLSSKSPSDLMAQMIEAKSDFQINVSSSIGSSVYQNGNAAKATTVVEGFSANESNVGTLSINLIAIPFGGRAYFYQIDSTQTSALFTGKTNTVNMNNGSFPAFTIQDYSTALTTMTFGGLTNYRLSVGSSLTINWNVDQNFPANGKSAVIVASEDEQTGQYTTFYKEVDAAAGTAALNASELAAFDNANSVKVYYARGSSTDTQVNEKTVSIENLVYTYARIFR